MTISNRPPTPSIALLHFIGICECLGALGLILPGVSRIQMYLTLLAAAGRSIVMIGETTVTAIGVGVSAAIFPVVVGVIATWIAYTRTRVARIAEAPPRVLRTT